VALGLAVRPGLGNGSAHGSKIPGDAAGEGRHQAGFGVAEPQIEFSLGLALNNGLEALDQGAGFGQGWRAVLDRGDRECIGLRGMVAPRSVVDPDHRQWVGPGTSSAPHDTQ
jgi:hypothetical protein